MVCPSVSTFNTKKTPIHSVQSIHTCIHMWNVYIYCPSHSNGSIIFKICSIKNFCLFKMKILFYPRVRTRASAYTHTHTTEHIQRATTTLNTSHACTLVFGKGLACQIHTSLGNGSETVNAIQWNVPLRLDTHGTYEHLFHNNIIPHTIHMLHRRM